MVFNIGGLARATGGSTKTIRFYEASGLMPPAQRAENGYRRYADRDVERLRFIRSARALGFPIGDLTEIMAMRDRGQEPCRQVMERLISSVDDVDERIRNLQMLQRELKQLLAAAQALPLDPDDREACVCDLITQKPRILALSAHGLSDQKKAVNLFPM